MKDHKWKKNHNFSNKCKYFPDPNFAPYRDFSPLELFELFFDDEMYDLFVTETRRYAIQQGTRDPHVTKEEMKCFIGVLIVSGYSVCPGKRYYWDQEDDMRNYAIYNAMRRNRFESIMQCFHLANNANINAEDKFAKVRPMSDLLKQKFMLHFQPVQFLSHDESMIEYFGKHGCKQCIRNKPIRFGYKVWCLSTANGYLINFDLYQGKTLDGNMKLEKIVGKCSATVLHLLDHLPDEKRNFPYFLFFDNLFSGYELLMHLRERNYLSTGTIRDNRLRKCPIQSVATMKKEPRGSLSCATDLQNDIHVCRWVDNAVVTMVSNVHGNEPMTQAKRYSQKEKKIVNIDYPNIVKQYNAHMGGTDRFNQDTNRLRVGIRGKKWWWSVFTWLLDISISNAWHLATSTGSSLSQLQFRRHSATIYLKRHALLPQGGGRPSTSISRTRMHTELRKDGLGHLIVSCKRRRCAGDFCQKHPSTMCEKCNIGLCIDCFKPYHT